jgi:hypothetical protein
MLTPGALTVGVLALTGCGQEVAPGSGSAPAPAITTAAPESPTQPSTGPSSLASSRALPAPGGSAPVAPVNIVQPDAAAIDLKPLPWNRALPIENGRKLQVDFTTDGSDCQILGKVITWEGAKEISVVLLVGRLLEAQCDGVRPAIAFPAQLTITLKKPLAGRSIVQSSKT